MNVTPLATPRRYARLFAVQLKASVLTSFQYRADFLFDGAVELLWAATGLVPLLTVLSAGRTLGGWTYGEAVIVLGWFTLLKAVLDGALSPSVAAVVEHVRKGTLDFVLLKPADAQFLVSTCRFYPWRSVNVITGVLLFVHGFRVLGRAPALPDVALSLLLLGEALAVLYGLLLLTASVAFYAVRVDNLTFFLGALFDAARWPASVFRGAVWFFFTFVLPLTVMTTYPAAALLGRLTPGALGIATGAAVAFVAGSRLVWRRAIGAYTSAG